MIFRRWPAAVVRDNFLWAKDSGGVWAMWEITPESLDWWKADDLVSHGQRWANGLGILNNEWAIWGTCQMITPDQLYEKSVQKENSPAWIGVASDVASQDHWIWKRRVFVGVRISGPWRTGLIAYLSGLMTKMSKTRRAPAAQQVPLKKRGFSEGAVEGLLSEAEQGAYRAADAALTNLGGRPAKPVDMVWLSERMADPNVQPDQETMGVSDTELVQSRHHLSVLTQHGSTEQMLMVVSRLPARWEYPSHGTWLGRLDSSFTFPIDWVVRSMPDTNDKAIKGVRKSLRNMVSTASELGTDPAGLPPDLVEAYQGATAAESFLQSTGAPELRAVICYRLWADDLAELKKRAIDLEQTLGGAGVSVSKPTGGQVAAWKMHLPGSHVPQVGYDYHQWVTPHAISSAQPQNSYSVGDPRGIAIGYSAKDMVFIDPAYGPATNRPGAIGMIGEPGSGKSYTSKILAGAHLLRGGRLVVLDRTELGEWKTFIETVMWEVAGTRDVAVLRLDEGADFDLNPLRLFNDKQTAIKHATSVCQILTGVKTRSGGDLAVLIKGIRHIVDNRLPINRLYRQSVLTKKELARSIEGFAENTRMGKMVFNNAKGKQLDTDAAAIVWWVPGLTPPPPGLSEDDLSLDHVISSAIAYLVSALTRQSTFGDLKRFGVNMYDEAWALTSSQAGSDLLRQEIRDGRKHNAALWLASQHPSDLGAAISKGAVDAAASAQTLAAMIPTRMLFRLQTAEAAQLGLTWLGAEHTQDRIDQVMALQTGQCIMRDLDGRICRVSINPPWVKGAIAEAMDTNPDRASVHAA